MQSVIELGRYIRDVKVMPIKVSPRHTPLPLPLVTHLNHAPFGLPFLPHPLSSPSLKWS